MRKINHIWLWRLLTLLLHHRLKQPSIIQVQQVFPFREILSAQFLYNTGELLLLDCLTILIVYLFGWVFGVFAHLFSEWNERLFFDHFLLHLAYDIGEGLLLDRALLLQGLGLAFCAFVTRPPHVSLLVMIGHCLPQSCLFLLMIAFLWWFWLARFYLVFHVFQTYYRLFVGFFCFFWRLLPLLWLCCWKFFLLPSHKLCYAYVLQPLHETG